MAGAGRACGRTGLTRVDLSRCRAMAGIGEDAFAQCSELSTVDLAGCTALEALGAGAFA